VAPDREYLILDALRELDAGGFEDVAEAGEASRIGARAGELAITPPAVETPGGDSVALANLLDPETIGKAEQPGLFVGSVATVVGVPAELFERIFDDFLERV
jgi:hypothetical protein